MTHLRSTALNVPGDFAVLREQVMRAGLLERQYRYYLLIGVPTVALLGLSIMILFATDNMWMQILNAVLMAFVSVQIGFLFHDACHRQIFTSIALNNIVAYIGGFFLGGSPQWWMNKHNRHHADPNHEGMDPDIDVPFIAYTEEQALERHGLERWVVKHQHRFFLPIQSFANFAFINGNIAFLRTQPLRKIWLDAVIFISHFLAYGALLLAALPFWVAVVFVIVHRFVFGFYMGMVFATNHKGMPVYAKGTQLDFLRKQVFTARNIRSNAIVDILYGGLNYQVEHHVFPTMPRNRFHKASTIVKVFCAERGIPYYETGVIRSYTEIIQELRRVSRVLYGSLTPARVLDPVAVRQEAE